MGYYDNSFCCRLDFLIPTAPALGDCCLIGLVYHTCSLLSSDFDVSSCFPSLSFVPGFFFFFLDFDFGFDFKLEPLSVRLALPSDQLGSCTITDLHGLEVKVEPKPTPDAKRPAFP